MPTTASPTREPRTPRDFVRIYERNRGRRAKPPEPLPHPGRPQKFTTEQMLKCFERGMTVYETALQLGVTTMAIYSRARSRNIPTPDPTGRKTISALLSVTRGFRGKERMVKYAESRGLTVQQLRTALTQGTSYLLRLRSEAGERKPWEAAPHRLLYVKAYNELLHDPGLFDDPERLARKTNLPLEGVQTYLTKCFDRAAAIAVNKAKQKKEKTK